MLPALLPDPDGFAAFIRERMSEDPRDVERQIRILEGRYGAGLDRFDVDGEQAAILRRVAEQGRKARRVLEDAGWLDPDSGKYEATEEEARAVLEAAGVFDGWEGDFKAFWILECVRLARQRRN
jgi:hypothetical protein